MKYGLCFQNIVLKMVFFSRVHKFLFSKGHFRKELLDVKHFLCILKFGLYIVLGHLAGIDLLIEVQRNALKIDIKLHFQLLVFWSRGVGSDFGLCAF